jgi:homeobox-leucine zipper protein
MFLAFFFQQMKAELQVLSPLVPIREVIFLRFCKQLAEGAWAVVDVSIDGLLSNQNSATTPVAANLKCRRLPSGCVMQDTPNGYCKVITMTENPRYIFSLSNNSLRFTYVWCCK